MSMEQTLSQRVVQEAGATEVFSQVGTITRLLHDALSQLGVMPGLQQAADGLPDARCRLNYIGDKTASAAEKVLNSVEQAMALNGPVGNRAGRADVVANQEQVDDLLASLGF